MWKFYKLICLNLVKLIVVDSEWNCYFKTLSLFLYGSIQNLCLFKEINIWKKLKFGSGFRYYNNIIFILY